MVALTILRYDWRRAPATQNEAYVDHCSRARDKRDSTRGPRHQSGAHGSRNVQDETLPSVQIRCTKERADEEPGGDKTDTYQPMTEKLTLEAQPPATA